jgi:hypothetical protein
MQDKKLRDALVTAGIITLFADGEIGVKLYDLSDDILSMRRRIKQLQKKLKTDTEGCDIVD